MSNNSGDDVEYTPSPAMEELGFAEKLEKLFKEKNPQQQFTIIDPLLPLIYSEDGQARVYLHGR